MFQDREWYELAGSDFDPRAVPGNGQTTDGTVTTAIAGLGGHKRAAEQPYGNMGAAGLRADARRRKGEDEDEDHVDDEADDDFDDDDDLDDDFDDDFDDDEDADEDFDDDSSDEGDDEL